MNVDVGLDPNVCCFEANPSCVMPGIYNLFFQGTHDQRRGNVFSSAFVSRQSMRMKV